MLDQAPIWAKDVMIFGIVALLLGLGLIIYGNYRRSQGERRD